MKEQVTAKWAVVDRQSPWYYEPIRPDDALERCEREQEEDSKYGNWRYPTKADDALLDLWRQEGYCGAAVARKIGMSGAYTYTLLARASRRKERLERDTERKVNKSQQTF